MFPVGDTSCRTLIVVCVCVHACGAVRCGAVRCGAVRCGAVRCGAVRCGAVRCGACVRACLSADISLNSAKND